MNDQQFTPVTPDIRRNPDGTCVCVNAMTNSPFFSLVFPHENLLRMAVDEWNSTEGKSDPTRWSTLKVTLPTPVPAAGTVPCDWRTGTTTSCPNKATHRSVHSSGGFRHFCNNHAADARTAFNVELMPLPETPDADVVIVGVAGLKKRYDIAVDLNAQAAQKIDELRAERDKLRSSLLHIKSRLNSMAGHRLMQVAGPARELLNYLKTQSL